MKQRSRSPAERDHVWMGAVKNDVLLILYVNSKSEACHTAKNNVTRKLKEKLQSLTARLQAKRIGSN